MTYSIQILLLGVFALVKVHLTAFSQDADTWVKPPSQEQLDNIPGLLHHTIESKAMKTTIGYCIILPPGYNDSDDRYPVIYWLHGGGGNESSSLFTAETWYDLYENTQFQKVIIVYPNAYRSGYMDHFDKNIMIESMIIDDLIPHIDATYRTVALRGDRAVHGFSMGASGSLKFAIKYPDLFCSAVAYGGGAIDLEKTTDQWILDILKNNLNSDPELVRQNNTYHFLEKNHEMIRQFGTPFLLICGDEDGWKESAITFQHDLNDKNIPCDLTLVPGVTHDIVSLIRIEGKNAATFQNKVFKRTLKR